MPPRSFEQLARAGREHRRVTAASVARRNTDVRFAYEQIRSLIREGPVAAGTLLESRLVDELGAGRNAVRAALRRLTDEGLLARSPKRGTAQTRRILQCRVDDVLPGVTGNDGPVTIHRLGHEVHTGIGPLRIDYGRLPAAVLLVEQLAVLAGEPIYRRLICIPHDEPEEACGGEQISATITATSADTDMASDLQIPLGQPLILRRLVHTDRDGAVRQVSFTHFRGDRVAIVDGTR
ncbi:MULTISPECIES: GntR family transcriptional regulator [Rhodococcus]|uniref:GntR family transcriptional regulator n=1 Tax=Rhodococcus TaxID=1827 RepID=UPI000A1C7D8D|nr:MULTISPECIES: GntR family transcriptional regulator [Rhodococcus]MBF4481133.1 GntR family transcriptional regulator [Rhodococcus rhodochrous]MDC3728512.1 GntR family transcriptional regulator [Rhodococcus sp. Rp3]WSE24188.1 GntR family transcriptional regulator [Rhodococcus sp. PD04]